MGLNRFVKSNFVGKMHILFCRKCNYVARTELDSVCNSVEIDPIFDFTIDSGSSREFFSIGINHGGYFLGTGTNRAYVNGSVIWYDNFEIGSWSHSDVENVVEEIGYDMTGRLTVHYCVPVLAVNRNGLREIRSAHDTINMLEFVSIGYQFLELYLDHDQSLKRRDWDDVVQFPLTQMPPVLSPMKSKLNVNLETAEEAANEPVPIKVVPPQEPHVVRNDDAAKEAPNETVPIEVVPPQEPPVVPSDEAVAVKRRRQRRKRGIGRAHV